MIKKFVSLLSVFWGATSVLAQTAPVQAPQTYPYPGYANTNRLGVGGLIFSNGAGQNFTPEQLAAQLQNLRSVVEQALPILSAFNQQYSNSVTGGRQTVGGELSGIVSDVLHRNQAAGQNYTFSQSSLTASNLLSMLHGLLNTNSTSAVGPNPGNAQDLIALQNDLQPVELILQRLNVSAAPNQGMAPSYTPSPLSPGGNLPPTGR